MADSGTYTPETLARRYKMAEQLLAPQPIRHWAEGLNELAKGALGGYQLKRTEDMEKQARADAVAQALGALGAVTPSPAATSAPSSPTSILPTDASLPRGIRNNNPLNIEAGSFTQGQPGFSGSDGRFARFDTPEAGIGAANKLLDIYQNKYGLNTPAGIIGRWAPAGDGNNVSAYASAVAKQLGISPNDPVPPEMRPQLIAAMGQHENGRPIGPAGGASPQQMAQAAPQQLAPAAGSPDKRAAIAALLNPFTPAGVQGALAQQLKPAEYGFQSQPDGTILRTNPRTGQVEPVYQGATKPELKETGTDPITGKKSFMVFDPKTQTMKSVDGSQGQSNAPQNNGMLAPGVTQLDPTLSGDDYLKQFSPEVQSAVKAYMNGDVMPSGNPRMQGMANQAKIIAQKYGADMGIPVSDATYSQRRTYRSQLGSNSPASAGGQAKAFSQGIEHMGHLADTLEKLDNSNGLGIPVVANAVNSIRQGTSTDQAAIADKASSIGQTLAGEVGKLFSGSAGGGVHERELTRERFSTVKSKPQLAAALEGTLEMMQGGLTALEQRRDEVMGPNSGIRFITPETETKIAQIRSAIERLKGNEDKTEASATMPDRAALEAEMRKRGFLK